MPWYCDKCQREIAGTEVEVGGVNDERAVTTYHVVALGERVAGIHRVRAIKERAGDAAGDEGKGDDGGSN